tara:strand:+ start:13855 stop:14082 length:228 start_codon:yes stop_codon:yes gene_type:complete
MERCPSCDEEQIEKLFNREQELMVFIDDIKPQLNGLDQREARRLIAGQAGLREIREILFADMMRDPDGNMLGRVK